MRLQSQVGGWKPSRREFLGGGEALVGAVLLWRLTRGSAIPAAPARSSFATGYSKGNPSDPALLLYPQPDSGNKLRPPLICLHGADALNPALGAEQFVDTVSLPHLSALVASLANAGFACFAPNMDGNTWGNDVALKRISEALDYLGTLGYRTDRVGLLGISMGGGAAYTWARAHRSAVGAMVGILPLSDLNGVHADARFASSIDAAYGGAYRDAIDGPTHNPKDFASSLAGMPTQVWYAIDDNIVLPSTVGR